ncbi:MAG: nitrous oxide-stimulated promoter family protein [Candidatus Glassbacteria bacterium]|nr:nitrous oxide-stimulated promoter family protein [Candidatus Glassbacteria bacterium]
MAKDKAQEYKVLEKFIGVYCRSLHQGNGGGLCSECSDLLAYAGKRLEKCPYHPKPKCKGCETHCYKPEYRKKIQEVMRFSGIYFIKRGRLDWLLKYFM